MASLNIGLSGMPYSGSDISKRGGVGGRGRRGEEGEVGKRRGGEGWEGKGYGREESQWLLCSHCVATQAART